MSASGDNQPAAVEALDDFEDLFENAPCGYISTDKDGRITRANETLARWIGVETVSLVGKRFPDLLTIGGKLFYETHFAPLLRMQGAFSEVAVDLACADGQRIPALVNAVDRRDAQGEPLFIRFTVFNATERRRYERSLLTAKSEAEQMALAERATAKLRDQFIAVLGHDLRNPLASIAGGVRLLSKEFSSDRARKVLALMDGSVVRAAGLIDNVMDFARASLGSGIDLRLDADAPIAQTIEQVVAELRSIAGDREIIATIDIGEPVAADAGRIGQLMSNLLGNALTHGAPDQPVHVGASTSKGTFELWVANAGSPIPPEGMSRLFQPFFRGDLRPMQEGLGLGLHIAAEIAKAHRGDLVVASDAVETRFTFRMSCAPKSWMPCG